MTAQAVVIPPIDLAPPPPALSQDSASGEHFLSLLTAPPTAAPPPSTPPVNTAAPPQPVNASPAPQPTAPQPATPSSKAASTGTASSNTNTNANNGNATHSKDTAVAPAALAVTIPLPQLPLPAPAPAGLATSAAPPAPISAVAMLPKTTPPSPPPLPAGAASAAALFATTALASTQSGGSLAVASPGATTAAAKLFGAATTLGSSAGPANTATLAPSAPSAQPGGLTPSLPDMAATMGLRIASSATNLVSQPRAALASVAPEGLAGKAAATDLTAVGHEASADGTPSAGKPTALTTVAGQLAIAAKEAGVAPALLRDPTAPATSDPAAASATAPSPAASAGAPPVATLTPPPAVVATDAAQALPVMPHAVAAQVAASLGQAVRSGSDHIQIQLQPADLGAVAVKLSINHDGRVTMVLSADRSDTLNLLQQNQASLTQALRDAGLSADSSSLSFNLRGGFQFQQPAAGGNGSSGGQSAATIDAPVAAEAVALTRLSFHSGSLDIHV